MVRTEASQALNPGSIPGRVTNENEPPLGGIFICDPKQDVCSSCVRESNAGVMLLSSNGRGGAQTKLFDGKVLVEGDTPGRVMCVRKKRIAPLFSYTHGGRRHVFLAGKTAEAGPATKTLRRQSFELWATNDRFGRTFCGNLYHSCRERYSRYDNLFATLSL